MASMGGSAWGSSSQPRISSPFGAANPFTTPNQAPVSTLNPFANFQNAPTGSQAGGGAASHNPFASTSQQIPQPNKPSDQPNPFSVGASSAAQSFANPFSQNQQSGQVSQTPSVFFQPNNQSQAPSNPFATSSSFLKPQSSPFGAVSTLGPANNLPTGLQAPSLNTLNPSNQGNTRSPSPFGTSSGGFNGSSEWQEPSFGLDGAGDAKWAKRKGKKQFADITNLGAKRKGTDVPDGSTSDENRKRKNQDDKVWKRKETEIKVQAASGNEQGPKKTRQEFRGNAKPQVNGIFGSQHLNDEQHMAEVVQAMSGRQSRQHTPYAKAIYDRLQKDNITPPKWPSDPGNPSQKAAMAGFKADFKAFRDRARTSLIQGGLIDDPDKPKRLEDAIVFKGICEDMCPEYEKATRITEFDVQHAEKDSRTTFASTPRMIKKLARSAAGQEAPLPMDVRSTAALRRTLDYLIDDLLRSDGNLPVMHGFLWDRTRAIRRDFVFHSTMSPDEMKDQVYCLETITRFHVTALHLLSQKGFSPEDFSEQQEIEQLGKSLLSLMFAYDDCKPQGVVCENEAEFRAYHLLYSGNTPNILDNVQKEWGDSRFWKDSDEIRTAVSLVEALQNILDLHGPLGRGPSMAASSAYNTYFRIVEDAEVSYTMACFAEIHFGQLRRSILQALKKAYGRPRGGPKDITPAVLNKFLRFDTEDEAIDFVEQHGLTFVENEEAPGDISRGSLDTSDRFEYARLHHTFSKTLVEKKRGSELLPTVMHRNVFDSSSPVVNDEVAENANEDSLFVPGAEALKAGSKHVRFSGIENNSASTPPVHPQSTQPANGTGPVNGSFGLDKASSSSGANATKPVSSNSSPFTAFNSPPLSSGGSSNSTEPPVSMASSSFLTPTGIPGPVKESPASQKPFPSIRQPDGALTVAATLSPAHSGTQEQRSFINGEQTSIGAQPSSSPWSNDGTTSASSAPVSTPRFPTYSESTERGLSPFASPANFKSGAVPSSFTASPAPSMLPPSHSADVSVSQVGSAPSRKLSSGNSQTQPSLLPPHASTASSSSKPFGFPATSSQNTALTSQVPPKAPGRDLLAQESSPSQGSSVSKVDSASRPFATLAAPPSVVLPPTTQMPKKDRMGDFTRWFVTGDEGLMQEFEIFAVEQIVRDAYEQFIIDEEDKKRREEEEKDLAEARNFQVYNLSLKYFYRWREIARNLRLSKIRRREREEYRAAQSAKRVADIAAKKKAAKIADARLQALRRDGVDTVEEFRNLLRLRKDKDKDNLQMEEDALLATGILSGVSNEREAIASIVRHEDVVPFERGRLSTNKLAEPAITTSLSQSLSMTKSAGSKTRALREEFSANHHNFRRSLPPMSSHSSSSRFTSPTQPPKRISKVSDRWRLKAMGLVTMPNGTALPESLANAMKYEGKRYPGLGSFGLDSGDHRIRSISAELQQPLAPRHRFSKSLGSNGNANQVNGSSPLNKRKRLAEDESDELVTNGEPPPSTKKQAPSTSKIEKIIEEARENMRALRHSREDLDEGTDWFREQNERMRVESMSRGSSPWAQG